MDLTLTPAQVQAVHNGFTRVGKAPPAGYSPKQIQLARQLGYTIPTGYIPGNGLNKVGGARKNRKSSRKNRKSSRNNRKSMKSRK